MKTIRTLRLLLLGGATVGILFAVTSMASHPIAAARLLTAEKLVQQLFLPLTVKPGSGLSIAEVKVIQGTSASPDYAVYIAGRPTVVRVFVSTGSHTPVPGVAGKLCAYDADGGPLGCIPADNQTITAPSSEEDLATTLNFSLPLAWINPGFGYHVEIDPDNLIAEGNRDDNRYPFAGLQPFDFVSVPPIDVVIVPVEYQPYQGSAYLPRTDDLSYLTTLPIKLLPVAQINYQLRSSYLFAPDNSEENLDNREGKGWVKLLGDLTAIHSMEDGSGSKNYYGLVNSYDAHNCEGGCITGIGWIWTTDEGYRTAAGWSGWGAGNAAAGETFTHEVGHNFGMRHAPCPANLPNLEVGYPYGEGKIGQFGLDVAGGLLFHPDSYSDYMSYCKPNWTSDYTFWKIYERRRSQAASAVLTDQPTEALYVSGMISAGGEVLLRPVYSQLAPLPVTWQGSHRLELLAGDGRVLAVRPFDPVEIGDIEGYSGFGFFVPALDGLEGIRILDGDQVMVEKYRQPQSPIVAAEAGVLGADLEVDGKRIQWRADGGVGQQVVYRLRYSQDEGETWQVLALDLKQAAFDLPDNLGVDGEGVLLEIQASDGFNTDTKVYRWPVSPVD